MKKPKIFLNVGTYLPGYRGGGPTQSVKNLINALSDEFDFYIFTANHDLGISTPYKNIKTDSWNDMYESKIFYTSDKNKDRNLEEILKRENFSLIFLNSFFSTDTIKIIAMYHKFKLETPIILMPRGELSEGALNIKKTKKMAYIKLANSFNFLDGVNYLSTAEDEFRQIKSLLNTDKVSKVSNIPNTQKELILNTKAPNSLKVVFLSRITEKKNLDYALNTLQNCENKIYFDIYGTIEDKVYWEKCKKNMEHLPNNIIVKYRGELSNEEVIRTLSKYDLFYLPTKSENYGHVISEALQASIPVLISDQTPWKNLEEEKLGWDYSLGNLQIFADKIDELSLIKKENYDELKRNIYSTFRPERTLTENVELYQSIFYQLIESHHEKSHIYIN